MKATTKPCVWCGKKGKKVRHARVQWEGLDSTWYRCRTCGSLMILPRPSSALIRKVYETDYLNKKLQPHTGVDSRIRYSKAYRPTVFSEYALTLADLGVRKQDVRSILDFGCADGVFLEFCKTHFGSRTKVYGTDISASMLEQARRNGWNVFLLDEIDSLPMRFDLITLWDVIEHVADPGAVIRKLSKLLAPNGRILIQTPRFDELGELFGEHWAHLLPVQHLSVASKKGMQTLIRRMGLVIEAHHSFGAHAPSTAVAQPYKRVFDQLAKKLDFGDVQIVSVRRRMRA